MRRECSTQRRRGAGPAKKVRLMDVVDVNTSSSPKFEGVKRYISTGAVVDDYIDESQVVKCSYSDRPSRADLYPKIGDVLFAKMQATRKTLIIDTKNKDALYSTGFYALSPHESVIDSRYLASFLGSDYFLSAKDKECHGATQKALSNLGLQRLLIPLPNVSFQKRIAAVLDKICELKKNAEMRLEKLDTLIKSRFVEMFEGERYPMVAVGDVFAVKGPKRIHKEEWKNDGVPFYRVSNLSDLLEGRETTSDTYISRQRFEALLAEGQVPKAGDVLVTARGTLGRCYVVKASDEFYFQDGMITWLSDRSEKIALPYFLYASQSHSFKRQYEGKSSGTTVAYMTIGQLAKYKLPLPPLALQREFAAFAEKVDKLRETARQMVKAMDTLYRAKLQEFFG